MVASHEAEVRILTDRSRRRPRVPITVQFEEPRKFLLQASGTVTLDQTLHTIDEILGHESLSPGSRILVHGEEVTKAPSTAELFVIAREMKILTNYGVVAVAIVTGHTFVYGIARIFAVFAQNVGMNVAVFHSLDQASRWFSSGVHTQSSD